MIQYPFKNRPNILQNHVSASTVQGTFSESHCESSGFFYVCKNAIVSASGFVFLLFAQFNF